jgi:hypothetical protein
VQSLNVSSISFPSSIALGKGDLLGQEGFCSSRAEFIRTAIRNQLDAPGGAVGQTVTRRSMFMEALVCDREELEKLRARGEGVAIRVVGTVQFGEDITPELALDIMELLQVLGVLQASLQVKQTLTYQMP